MDTSSVSDTGSLSVFSNSDTSVAFNEAPRKPHGFRFDFESNTTSSIYKAPKVLKPVSVVNLDAINELIRSQREEDEDPDQIKMPIHLFQEQLAVMQEKLSSQMKEKTMGLLKDPAGFSFIALCLLISSSFSHIE